MSPASPQDDQAEIVQAALRLYRQFGPDKVSMDDIAKATGRSRTSIYYYFKNHNEIFRAAIEAIVMDAAKDIRKAVFDTKTLDERVYTFCVAKLRISRECSLILDSMWAAADLKEQKHQLKAAMGIHQKLVHQEGLILKEILAAAAERKEIRALSAEEIGQWVFVITSGIRGIRNEIPDQILTPAFKASIKVLSQMAVKWVRA